MIRSFFNKVETCKTYAEDIQLKKREWIKIFADFVSSYVFYKFNTENYFVIGNGYTLSKYEKKRFFTYRRSLELMKKVNNPKYIHFLENKAEALSLFKDLVSRCWLYAPKSSFGQFMDFVKKTPTFIAKPVGSKCGWGIEKHFTDEMSEDCLKTLYNHMVEKDMLLEECLKAHDDIFLGTTALSTFRIYTMIDKNGEVHILKAKYRVGTGNSITDTDDGCIAYPISIKYGIKEGPGINEVLNSNYYYYHPGCDKLMVGMIIPLWDRVLEVVTKAANMIPQIRYIGWDIAITNNSVEIIEGNHDPYHGTFEIMGTERLWWPKLKAMI